MAVDTIIAVPGGFAVHVRARNAGGATASAVIVRGELRAPSGVESAESTLDYLPPFSTRIAGLIFRSDPRSGPLTVTVAGYALP